MSDIFLHHSTLYASNANVTILQGTLTLCGAILMSLQESHMIMIQNVNDKYIDIHTIYVHVTHSMYIYTPCKQLSVWCTYATLVLNTKILTSLLASSSTVASFVFVASVTRLC